MNGVSRRLPRAMAAAMTGLSAMIAVGCAPLDTFYKDPWHARVAAAGTVEKNVDIGAVSLDFVEGPDNGPALLLLHAQHMD
jgi:hypothetical protein